MPKTSLGHCTQKVLNRKVNKLQKLVQKHQLKFKGVYQTEVKEQPKNQKQIQITQVCAC